MAEVKLFTVTVTENDIFSENDILKIYWDNVAEEIVVYKNDIKITSGADLGNQNINFSITSNNYSFCDGTTKVYFKVNPINPAFPYAEKLLTANDSACQSDPVACDITLNIISVQNESSSGASDGVITVSGDSSLSAVEYALSPFAYGEGQSSSTFSGLSAGSYTIYSRDSQNCQASVSASVFLAQDHGVKYRSEWDDLQGSVHRFDIAEDGYFGAITEKDNDSEPFTYSKASKGIGNFYKKPIEPSSTTVNLISDTNFLYRELYTQDERKYKGTWYIDSVEQWSGYLIPSTFSESYTSVPYVTSLTFTDGLQDLDKIDYLQGDEKITGVEKVIKIIARVLGKLELGLSINCGVNIYSGSMDSAATDDPFDQAYLDNETFFRKDEPFTCYEVLDAILIDFGARIYQWQGKWWISRIEEENAASYDYRTFDSLGDYVSNSSLSPKVNIDEATATNRLVFSNRDQTYQITPSYSEVVINNELNKKDLVVNGGFIPSILGFFFEGFEGWSFILRTETPTLGESSFFYKKETARFNNTYSWDNANNDYITTPATPIAIGVQDRIRFSYEFAVDKISTEIPQMSLDYVVKLTLDGDDYYLKEDGEWSENVAYRTRHNASPSSGFGKYEIFADSPLSSGANISGTFQISIHNYCLNNGDFGNVLGLSGQTELRDIETTSKPVPYKIDGRAVLGGLGNAQLFYELKVGDEADSFPNVVRPTDYDGTTNKVYWELQKTMYTDSGLVSNVEFYVDNVELEVLPIGEETPLMETLSTPLLGNNSESFELDVVLGDLTKPRIVNDVNSYNDYYRLSDGSPIADWERDGIDESDPIQYVLLKQLANQYGTTTNKLTGSATSLEDGGTGIYLAPYNVLVETHDNNTVYHIDGLTIRPKSNSYSLELLELKTPSTGSGGASSFNGDYNSDYGNSYDTTLN